MVHFIEKETKKSRRDEKCFKMKTDNIIKRNGGSRKETRCTKRERGLVFVAQEAEQSLPTSELFCSKPVIGNSYLLYSTVSKRKLEGAIFE